MKKYIEDFLDPFDTFYRMIEKKMTYVIILLPIVIGVIGFLFSVCVHIHMDMTGRQFMRDVLSDFVTVLALFVSFTMGYLSIIITSSSSNILDLKHTESKHNGKDGLPYTLYQVITTQITYAVIVEIVLLLLCIIEKFIINYFPSILLKILCAIDISAFVHVIIVLMLVIQNIYLTFWNSNSD